MTIFYDTDKSLVWDDASVPVCEHPGHDDGGDGDLATPVAVLAIALDVLAERDQWSYWCGSCCRAIAVKYLSSEDFRVASVSSPVPGSVTPDVLDMVTGIALCEGTVAGETFQMGGWVVRLLPCPIAL